MGVAMVSDSNQKLSQISVCLARCDQMHIRNTRSELLRKLSMFLAGLGALSDRLNLLRGQLRIFAFFCFHAPVLVEARK